MKKKLLIQTSMYLSTGMILLSAMMLSGCGVWEALQDPNSTVAQSVADANSVLESVAPLAGAFAGTPWGWIVGLGVIVAQGVVNVLYGARNKNLTKTTTAIVEAVENVAGSQEVKDKVATNLKVMKMYDTGSKIITGIKEGLLK